MRELLCDYVLSGFVKDLEASASGFSDPSSKMWDSTTLRP